jgi:CHAD domain-containing protein
MYAQVFQRSHGDTIEDYVDDIVVKSKKVDQLMIDLEKNLQETLRERHKTQPRKIRLRGPERYAAQVRRL